MAWVYVPSRTFHYSPARAAWIWERDLSGESKPSDTSNGTDTPKESSCPESGTEGSMMPHSGTMLQPSMPNHGAERWISSVEASLANLTQSQENGGGAADKRNLWPEYLRIVRECRPAFVLGENVSGIWTNGFAVEVMASLEECGYCVSPFQVLACQVGGPSPRKRLFFIAHPTSVRCRGVVKGESVRRSCQYRSLPGPWGLRPPYLLRAMARDVSARVPGFSRVDDGLAEAVDGIRLCGNGVVPQQSAPAWQVIVDMARNIEAAYI